MNAARTSVALVVLVIGFSPMAMAASACSTKARIPAAARIFARASAQSDWSEYRSFKELPELKPESGMYAVYWQYNRKRSSVYIVEPGQDFWLYTRYCFSREGELEGMDFEIGTTLGWGHRAEGPVANGGFDASHGEFFSTGNGKAIGRPQGVGEIPPAVKPTLYRTIRDLPFALLLNRPSLVSRR